MSIARVLGQDDWLFYARTTDGVLVYYNSEYDWHWLESPYGGQPIDTEAYDEYKRTGEDRRDNSWMHMYVARNADELDWQECDFDPVSGEYLGWGSEKDNEFMASSRASYLCD